MTVRLLVVDGSWLMTWLIGRLTPETVEVEQARSFREAESSLQSDPPEAVVLTLTPSSLDWARLGELCSRHDPPIPLMCCLTVDCVDDGALGLPCTSESIVSKPFVLSDLRSRLQHLLERVDRSGAVVT